MLPISTSSDINHVKNMPYINLLEKNFGWLLQVKYLCREKGLRNTTFITFHF